MPGPSKFDRAKFKQLVLHLAKRSAHDPGFGGVKLNKLLYFCDFESYRLLGHSLTGETYRKAEFGPVAWHYLPLETELVQDGLLEIRAVPSGPYERKVRVAVGDPDLATFSEQELSLIDDVLRRLEKYGAAAVSALSHQESAGWRLVEEGDEIPYATVFISTDPIPAEDVERARKMAVAEDWASIRP